MSRSPRSPPHALLVGLRGRGVAGLLAGIFESPLELELSWWLGAREFARDRLWSLSPLTGPGPGARELELWWGRAYGRRTAGARSRMLELC